MRSMVLIASILTLIQVVAILVILIIFKPVSDIIAVPLVLVLGTNILYCTLGFIMVAKEE